MVRRLLGNREKTFGEVQAIMRMFEANTDTFPGDQSYDDLPLDRKVQLAMQFYQCERARLQKGKMVFDMLSHLVPLIVSLFALWVSMHK
ncbi:MAG: hypothetical protein A3J07_00365 [Candidatus Doudnabacteria bacterium RIFCSPLOWO2_02_FULL_49_13]|uniref:Uncharacterized protein n=1 Tax=Candidatus Doudnabacteria bacterium RIFCSPHIGHO2_12_FULL_48_16 TaxID=1817838 RepID=A0A1F5PIU8_9BACT|nr:MAG: hypothetical protein A3B77_00255 [Candidatus Doudnabacteria bacterium RIFCSPHIGHO2_02_FULL_49_24]OGE89561.1 MAG: hypothetical protein A2760_03515 [Candidatus Doudnabacteria bacterium RIFCSPHIGHO2_01_FULL_50_67]OGE89811.1 MAG: hypothetical protein A3E29_00285 [Candidatus Doudnabacteria bacterium RIFCSPHIGHO2_12_FULL_48_16]OGE97716.1 MAG: hypothetical protein A2990_00765 [Candidatus Doudnabacteria bacterium RIFCSPLOWO2_01_FULL_49_40]OGF02815.1 MAG: hypothetical protein A3J07_00365 [Candid